ncbi:MAG TPA: hypothetical protein VLL07_01285 [Pontiella sp.]|nr:hypothetical protein [Pontiella sp.]
MSDTDIYKNRERMPYGDKTPRRSTRRRRSDSQRAFDDHSRKRRSRNSGFRRFLHLYRKKENERVFWWSVIISIIVILTLLAIWQFWIREAMIRSENEQTQYIQYKTAIPETPVSATE